mmetsp:Transcript_20592/g.34484  ORF Transcript_20592/g.34484 Transcript_20592/m.34484 type:complete len:1027 (+) Transcript_20592:169-3249(+)|eukprot:CAMPEP_0174995038 /NCGR_PEP_ID=MMETSP0004_2-20121128/23968_1 /TAXON_ID=420556 /ORGANISM="Ochromonas sp., Strain CCMP1393" /LENGTH=1026 /DNA_ID=CAMNT_0016249339 /DNA_START=37 /DNA_END=3117 /DNA_ORIENTATION=+
MGNQASQLGDEPATLVAQKNLQHFDHSFKGELHTTSGPILVSVFGECSFAKRPILVVCKGASMTLIEEVGITSKTQFDLSYIQITAISWDHANSEVKFIFKTADEGADAPENSLIMTMTNSIEFEGEMKLRFSAMMAQARNARAPTTMYIGIFAGATKPKPFQRKRPNLSNLPAGKLPTLQVMRSMALDMHRGSYRPCPQGSSRRVEIALQHIYEGKNTFALQNVRGPNSISNQFRQDSELVVQDESLLFKPRGGMSDTKIEFAFDDISEWTAVDNDTQRLGDSGIEITSRAGNSVFFQVEFIRDVKHTMEYFWNNYKVGMGLASEVKLGSTHGRPIVSVATLSGDMPPPSDAGFVAQTEVIDQDGLLVRPGGKMASRRGSIMGSGGDSKVVPPENRDVKPHWHRVVLHQGWLLKQGGVGVGSIKSWIKRYFVLYKTSQGHFLVYYSDFTECPLYTAEKHHRNFVDMAKCTFIRPGSNKQDNPDTPPFSFDIVTTEREWTLCAESQDNAQRWLKLLTRAVDEDVAILPDEELIFNVKPKVDPLGVLPVTDYTTSLKVSAQGISVTTPTTGSKDKAEFEHYFWVYTDFYKWSLLSQSGKLALLVNVFADSSFSRRIEYVFRNKEAQRLATAIEYFIEKFMTLMHIRLETSEGAFDEDPVGGKGSAVEDGGGRLHQLNAADQAEENQMYAAAEELDLLGLDVNEAPPAAADPFGDDFGSTPSAPSASGATTSAPVGPPAAPSPFGSDDPFGSDPFGATPAPSAAAEIKMAPALSAQQIAQHRTWLLGAIAAGGGPLYDDQTLQVASKIEVRGSQCRLSLMYINQSPGTITNFSVEVKDPAGLMRFELSALPSTELAGLARTTQTLMLECMKPVGEIPQITLSYNDSLKGHRSSNTLDLPLIVTSFNEPLQLSANDFTSRWQQLVGPGQEAQEVLKPSYPIVPQQVHHVLSSTLKFGRIQGLADASEFVIYGAASLKTGALSPAGEKLSVGCLVKIEMNVQANALRVTLRTVHGSATLAILETVKRLLL